MIDKKFLQGYEPEKIEDALYKKWEESGFFNPDTCIAKSVCAPDAETFSMVLPPPNVTGTLHTGHAFMLVIQDIMTRFHRMSGKRTLWLPGTDHAAIATQSKVEKLLEKNKVRKQDLGRDKFLAEVEKFASESHDTIVSQVKKMGASVDWSREAFTLDEAREKAVRTAFKKMYEDGLIYRGHRIVNWDPKGQTTISDDEIVRQEETTKFYYLKYGPFTIATARPETKFGDKYVVMHPDDARYREYKHGDQFEAEWINGPITATVIKDESIDPELGTGVMTITPWHSQVDFEIAERHTLDKEQIIDRYGKLLPIAGEFAGVKIGEARDKIIEKLAQKGLVEKIDEQYKHAIATAERSGGMIEPQIMQQWFIDVNKKFTIPHSAISGIPSGSETTLKELMLTSVRNGQIDILPQRFEKVYFNWIENLRDWCISRQIWYGHRIPVWYKENDIFVGTEAPEGDGWVQDEDTLDTWFSAGLWTFSTLGWPDKTADFRNYHPTNVLETGYDIIFFWVARMILMSTYLLGKIPFETTYFHGLVRDAQGRKMSKSLGNIVDPVDLINKYGSDALRMGLIVGTGPGQDVNLNENAIRGYRKFANKLWNMTRFVLENTENVPENKPELTETDETLISELDSLITDITNDIEEFRYHIASEKIYHYAWHRVADEIIEKSKEILSGEESPEKLSRQWTLLHILATIIKTLHPFMPFVTEEIWGSLPVKKDHELLLVNPWPTPSRSTQ